MRKLVIGAVAVMLLAIATVAYAATEQKYSQKFTSGSPSKSVGTKFSLEGSDPTAADNNFRPKPARVVDLLFPAGTRIDSKGAPQCKATDADFASKGAAACPARTKVDTGRAADNAAEAKLRGATIPAAVSAYNRAGGLILYIRPTLGNPFVLRPVLRGTPGKNQRLVTTVKAITVPGDEAILTKFKLSTKPITTGSGSSKRTFIKSPPATKCPRGKLWTFKATLTYGDGTKDTVVSQQKCTR